MRLHDFGHAASEHVHLVAPEGTFLTDAYLLQASRHEPGRKWTVVRYRQRLSRHESIVYLDAQEERKRRKLDASAPPSPGTSLLLCNIWPETRGFVTPLRYITWYFTGLIALMASLAFFTNLLAEVHKTADAAVSLFYLLPAISLSFLLRPERELEIRWRLLSWSRFAAAAVMAISLLAAMFWLVDIPEKNRWILPSVYTGMLAIIFPLAVWAEMRCRRIGAADARGRKSELMHHRGIGSSLVIKPD